MSECLQYIFCCFYSSNHQTQRGDRNQTSNHLKKKISQKPKPKPSRILSKFKPDDTIEISKQQKKKGALAYTCPICTLYFNKILACTQCENNMCRVCVQSYEKKFQISTTQNMKCPFCNSQKSNFIDYELEARSYFDTTGKNGFLDPIQRKKIDDEMQKSKNFANGQNKGSIQLYRIVQQQANENGIPTQNNIGLVQQYIEVEIRRNQSNLEEQASITNLRSQIIEQNSHQRQEFHVTV